MRALIVGASPSLSAAHVVHLASKVDVVVAADGGMHACIKADIVPDAIVGDMDSSRDEILEACRDSGARIVRYPCEKNASDLDLAVSFAREKGADRLVLTGVTGGRLDHTLAALGTLGRAADLWTVVDEAGLQGWVLSRKGRRTLALAGRDAFLSVVALFGSARVRSSGLRHPLDGVVLGPLESHGLSNVIDATSATVSVRSGTIFVVTQRVGGMTAARAVTGEG